MKRPEQRVGVVGDTAPGGVMTSHCYLQLRALKLARLASDIRGSSGFHRQRIPVRNATPIVTELENLARACLLMVGLVGQDHHPEEDATEVGHGVLVVAGGQSAPLLDPAE